MTTQFFELQDSARSQTTRLIVLFTISVVIVVSLMSAVGFFFGTAFRGDSAQRLGVAFPVYMSLLFAVLTMLIITIGTLYQVSLLRQGGGAGVAESLGGRQLAAHTGDAGERRLLNIVEEMAIASGTPVPPVFLLEEPGINAFAAGYLPGDAVIGVTRGAIDNLSRDELQGVIAHEFSHIFNGDMRTNIRMIGVLHGLLALSLIGHLLLRIFATRNVSSDSKDKGGAFLMGIGLAMIILGSVGSALGGLIKAAISRQREYLADASAIQFTRNPLGIGGALKRIGGLISGSRLEHPNASIASHMYFAQGVFEGFTGLMATHPPLPKRIAAIDPNWDGQYFLTAAEHSPRAGAAFHTTAINQAEQSALASGFVGLPASSTGESTSPFGATNATKSTWGVAADRPADTASPALPDADLAEVEWAPVTARTVEQERGNFDYSVETMMSAPDQVGAPLEEHCQYAANLLRSLDLALLNAAHEPYSARALVMALLISSDLDVARDQLRLLQDLVKTDVLEMVVDLASRLRNVPNAARLPLVDMSLPMLRMLSLSQYHTFIKAFKGLVQADQKVSIFEWTLSQVLTRHLHSHYYTPPARLSKYYSQRQLTDEISSLLSRLAWTGNSAETAQIAFQAAAAKLPDLTLQFLPAANGDFRSLEVALNKLALASGGIRRELLVACAAAVSSDQVVKVREAELVRGIADLLDCPMPPLLGRPHD
jgi:Zn-dependent protease with chaperone function